MKECCEGGPMTAGCFHDHCTGPKEKPYMLAEVKFNNGNGALLCNRCSNIIAYGFDHEDKFHFCEKCDDNYLKTEWALDELAKEQW